MAEQEQRLFDPSEGHLRKADPIPWLVQSASSYAGGNWTPEGLDQAYARGPEGHEVFRTYRSRSSEEPSPETIKSYESLRGHISSQFDMLTRPREEGGAGISVEVTPDDPYSSFEDMHKDVLDNSRLRVMSTESTGGHSFFTNEENDKFRAVHDAYGHLATGRDFSRHGEEAAFISHRRMLPKDAHAALASETRGQNSYLNWGGGSFPDNKMVNMPDWATAEEVKPPAAQPKKKSAPSGEQQLPLW